MNQKYLRYLFISLILGTTVLLAEPSVYGFGHSGSSSSKPSISPKQMILLNRKNISFLKRQIAEQNERIDGLTSVIEGLSATLAELRASGTTTAMGSGNDNTALLKELGTMIDKINDNYVSKDELQKILKSKGKYTSAGKGQSTSEEPLEGKSSSKLYSEGVRLFVKKRYSEAKKRFTVTDTKGYKPAASNYYLGEIAYYTKKYEDAIFHFKKSAGLYDQASYIDTLLLHTAISLEKTGDKGQARAFYENIVENYQGKKSAKIAKEKLKKL
jgi:TolA-binding protein